MLLKKKNEMKDSSRNSEAILRYIVGLLVMAVVCLIFLIVINFIILHDSQNTENNEIKYLFLVSVEDESERSASEDFDASIIDGGVVKVVIDSRYFAEEVGVLSTDISEESGEDILYSYFAYLGAFGWEYIGIDENTFIFSRTS